MLWILDSSVSQTVKARFQSFAVATLLFLVEVEGCDYDTGYRSQVKTCNFNFNVDQIVICLKKHAKIYVDLVFLLTKNALACGGFAPPRTSSVTPGPHLGHWSPHPHLGNAPAFAIKCPTPALFFLTNRTLGSRDSKLKRIYIT